MPARRARRARPAAVAAALLLGPLLSGCPSGDGGRTTPTSTAPAPATSSSRGSASSGPPSSGPAPSTQSPRAPAQATPGTASTLVSGLKVPWGLAMLPDGSALVSERTTHDIVHVQPDGHRATVGHITTVTTNTVEGGLLGLVASPTFASDRTVFAYYTSAEDNRVVRFTFDGRVVGPPTPIFTGIPQGATHDGGRLAFGPDGYLYVTTGDTQRRDRAPDPSFLGGKVLRMTRDGKPAPGNPDAGSVVYTRGHRNPQGLAFGPGGVLYEAEFGQDTLDEINRLEPGKDYGWPTVEGTAGPSRPGLTPPLLTWPTDDASPSGLAYAGGSLWLAALRGERLYRIPVLADGAVGRPSALFQGRFGRLRTVGVAKDGSLWVTTSNRDGRGQPRSGDDRIIRIPLQ